MSWPGLAIAVHILGVLWWLGGLAFVTLVFIPALRAEFADDPTTLLKAVESRFAPQARIAVVLVGLSGAYLLWATGLWHTLSKTAFWWLDAMLAYWLVFALILFIAEPLGLMRRMVFSGRDPGHGWRRFHIVHMVLLAIGVIVIAAAAIGGHGY